MGRQFGFLGLAVGAGLGLVWSAVGAAPRGEAPAGAEPAGREVAFPAGALAREEIAARFRRLGLKPELPPERSDADAPPAWSATRLTRAPSVVLTAEGGPVSVQVNVDAQGNNIVGDAANEPTMAVDPTNPNRIVIGWRQFATAESNFREAGYAFSSNRGATWTAGVLDPGVFRSDPVVDVDSKGGFYFSGLTSVNNQFSVSVFKSTDGGQTWGAGVNAFGGDKQWMVVDRTGGVGDGHIYQHWTAFYSCCFPNDFTRSTDSGASFQGPYTIQPPEMMWGTNTVGPDGTFYACGAYVDTFGGHVVARSSNAKNALEPPVFDLVTGVDLGGYTGGGFVNPAGLLGQVWIVADHGDTASRGYLYMLGSVFNPSSANPLDVHIVRSVDGGRTWSRPVRVNDDIASGAWHWFGAIAVAPNGRIDVTWYDTRDDLFDPFNPTFSRVYYSHSLDQGRTWSASMPVTPSFNHYLGYPQQDKIGDYTQMVSDNGGANLAYAATFNLEQDVYFVRIGFDCDNNGVEDPLDVDAGASDCNFNDIPDGCEAFSDCNFNKTNDICDVGRGNSPDCNANWIPDECESLEDCDNNGTLDICDLASGESKDCNGNNLPDECDIGRGSLDRNGNGVPDECQTACCLCDTDCLDASLVDCAQMSGFPGGLGTACFDTLCPPPPANDLCGAAQKIPPGLSSSVAIDNRCASTDFTYFYVECDNGFQPFGTDLWYTYQAPCDGLLRVSLCEDTAFDTILAVYDGGANCDCPADDMTLAACGDDTCGIGGGPSIVTLEATADACYLIRVGGWDGSVGSGILDVAMRPTPGGAGEPGTAGFGAAGDCNGDTALTPADQAGFAECMLGPALSRSICCGCADMTNNNRVDLEDFAATQNAYSPTTP